MRYAMQHVMWFAWVDVGTVNDVQRGAVYIMQRHECACACVCVCVCVCVHAHVLCVRAGCGVWGVTLTKLLWLL